MKGYPGSYSHVADVELGARMADWTTQVADLIEESVAAIRDRTVVPLRAVVRAIAFGILLAFVMTMAGAFMLIGTFRALDAYLPGSVWSAHAVTGGIFLALGKLCWSRSRS